MTDGFPDRLTQLRARWQGDPSSRVFLQLAEEYRHLGRMREALEVLDAGLKEHPGYLSALVAKGRCHLELGEAERACGVLERVVQQDPTQMVANKLLVRAYCATGEAERARQRLDVYSLLTDSDPETEELAKRVAAMSRPSRATDDPRPQGPAERPGMGSNLPPEEGPHPAKPPAEAKASAAGSAAGAAGARGEVFDLGASRPAKRPLRDAAADEVFALGFPALEPPPGVGLETAAVEGAAPESSWGEPFPELSRPERRVRYLEALAAEGIFLFAVQAEPVRRAARDVEAATPMSAPEPAAAGESPGEPPRTVAEPEPGEEGVEGAATATLGFLYLRQGHLPEAERIFREVLRREPGNSAVEAALARVERRREPLAAAHLLAGFEPGKAPGLLAKKAFLLNSYLRRLRAGPRHVS